ncbi:SHOCT domain-containing protein [Nafulsella turpanensis]|uniref:hypothetical protein n=1 Tax=Nafulsella turpanensis TaxID=1265690 RepID=UPI000375BC12|nr:hypothetical protein [Nafulsella turpanensis]
MEFISGLSVSSLLFCSLFLIGFTALFFWPVHKDKGESAWEILHKKFAEGGLSVEQYQERKALLEQNKRK